MKPARFDYVAPGSGDEALAVLRDAPEDTALLAGGQSLVPLLNMRLAQPALVVDLNRASDLATVQGDGNGVLRLGAMVRQRTIETDPAIGRHVPLLAEAVRHVAHPAIRTRGTIGGSICHGEPSAELPCAVTALGGRMVLRSAAGTRMLSADAFFRGPLMTAVQPGEMLVGIELDGQPPRTGSAFVETTRTHGGFALAAAAAVVSLDAEGRVASARLCLGGVAPTPFLVGWIDDALAGSALSAEALGAVAARLGEELGVNGGQADQHGYRRAVAVVMARRALALAASRVTGRSVDG